MPWSAPLLWVLLDKGYIRLHNPAVNTWIAVIALSLVLAVGLSWSIVRRRLTGQADVDDVDEYAAPIAAAASEQGLRRGAQLLDTARSREAESASMENVVLVIHLILALVLIGVVLMQRSEGGGLGMGGGGGGVMSSRSAATALAKLTWILAIGFICTSIALTIIAAEKSAGVSVIDRLTDQTAPETAPCNPGTRCRHLAGHRPACRRRRTNDTTDASRRPTRALKSGGLWPDYNKLPLDGGDPT